MYEQYLRDPASVGEEWRNLFDNGRLSELPVIPTTRAEALGSGEPRTVPSAAPSGTDRGGVSLGLAVDVERKDGSRALLVPVIKHAEGMDFAAFHATYETLVEKARTGRLLPDDFAGGTITLTNPGTIGTVASVPRLMKGQGSIIATGAIRQIGPTRVMTLTSTYDHRVIQGAESGMFLRKLDGLLQGEERFYQGVA